MLESFGARVMRNTLDGARGGRVSENAPEQQVRVRLTAILFWLLAISCGLALTFALVMVLLLLAFGAFGDGPGSFGDNALLLLGMAAAFLAYGWYNYSVGRAGAGFFERRGVTSHPWWISAAIACAIVWVVVGVLRFWQLQSMAVITFGIIALMVGHYVSQRSTATTAGTTDSVQTDGNAEPV